MNDAQHTLGWYRTRLGNITGSMVGVLMKSGKGKTFSETAETYLMQLAAERTMNQQIIADDEQFENYLRQVSVTTKAMQWGTDHEADARTLYEQITGNHTVELGSCKHPTVERFASSPDGFMYNEESGEKICLEIKCPIQSTFIRYCQIESPEDLKKVKPEYYWQCMAHMACTGAQRTDFIAYSPWQQSPIHIVPIPRSEAEITSMLDRVRLANDFIQSITSKILLF